MSQPPPPGPPDPDRPPSPWEPSPGHDPSRSEPAPYGPPSHEQPPYGQPPAYEQPSYGPPSHEQPAYGQPSYEQPGEPPHGQQWAHQPPYTPQVPYGQYGPPSGPRPGGTNVLAILSLVLAFVFAPAGIVLGHLAKRQIRSTGEEGDQLATWGLVLSYVFTGLGLLACCGWIALVVAAGDSGTTY
ncbi:MULTISPECIES: DUF4190 domain-containing protein [unclassified Micromonospora]|uniref:DUF4190 domain-containing protein n=1 Tax=unclassified Micromonospora TaxID=2617518 RepID=UPI00331ACD3F